MELGDVVALLALLLSAYATWKSNQFRQQERAILELQERINSLVLKKEEIEADQRESAEVGANFVKHGSNNYRLRVFNRGPATAEDVHVSFPDGNELVLQEDINEKFPLARMERWQSVDLIAAIHMGSPRKMTVALSWKDRGGRSSEKTFHLTL